MCVCTLHTLPLIFLLKFKKKFFAKNFCCTWPMCGFQFGFTSFLRVYILVWSRFLGFDKKIYFCVFLMCTPINTINMIIDWLICQVFHICFFLNLSWSIRWRLHSVFSLPFPVPVCRLSLPSFLKRMLFFYFWKFYNSWTFFFFRQSVFMFVCCTCFFFLFLLTSVTFSVAFSFFSQPSLCWLLFSWRSHLVSILLLSLTVIGNIFEDCQCLFSPFLFLVIFFF